ncbi:GbsR/MarR family transcriptional regulator [Nocardioides terrisoli]|uniref:GbsR/MarR family transcriptional regulator n=1 Tax=Nocardioides terrisoli TaxID=3388267 RepID=UPI00287B9B9B|nr:MarR family transcriptional regulator [Nocardioides marmorisolisilvae]
MPTPDAAAQFVEDFALALSQIGFPRMPARVFTAALAAPEESLTARELAERLQVSPAAISGAVRYLSQLNLIRRTRVRGERVDRFGLGDDVWTPVFEAEIAAYGPLSRLCARALDGEGLSERGRDRVGETKDFLEFMAEEMEGLVERWRTLRRR